MGARGSTLVGPATINTRLLDFTKQDSNGVYKVSVELQPLLTNVAPCTGANASQP